MMGTGKLKDKQVLIYDSVDQQVKWLQCRLKQNGYTNDKFLAGGAGTLQGELPIGRSL